MGYACDEIVGTPTVVDARGGAYPGMHISKVTYGVASDSPNVVLGSTTSATSDGTTGEFVLFKVSPGVIIDNFRVALIDAFTSTGSPTFSYGFSCDLDHLLVNSDVDMTTGTTGTMYSMIGDHGTTGGGAAPGAVGGHWVTSDGDVDSDGFVHIVVSIGTAPVNVGKAAAYLYWHGENAAG